MKSDQINELAQALVTAQGEFSSVPKDSTNPFFKSKYADLATVVKTASPVLHKNGLAVSQFISEDNTLITYLIHKSGQYISHTMPLLISKPDAQGQGSAITYARRYSYMAVLGLVADEDDDGNGAQKVAPKELPTKPTAITKLQLENLRQKFVENNLAGKQATEYMQTVVGKSQPETEADYNNLMATL